MIIAFKFVTKNRVQIAEKMLQNDGYTRRSILCSSMVDNLALFVSCEIRTNNDLIRFLYLLFILQ
jgi:hypothetical protein